MAALGPERQQELQDTVGREASVGPGASRTCLPQVTSRDLGAFGRQPCAAQSLSRVKGCRRLARAALHALGVPHPAAPVPCLAPAP